MKTNKYFFPLTAFFTGLVFGISILGFFSFTNGPVSPAPNAGITPINATAAHVFFNNYIVTAAPFNQVIKGFTIDKVQLEAMNSIARENPELSGFRIYMGKDNNSMNIGIVVGVDNLGKDAVKNTIFQTQGQKMSPCPPVCDVNSPIVNN